MIPYSLMGGIIEAQEIAKIHVIEVDGPPRASFEMSFGPWTHRIKYRTLAIGTQDYKLRHETWSAIQNSIDLIKAELRKHCYHNGGTQPIIWWRLRPSSSQWTDDPYVTRCRLETTPQLPESFWDSLAVFKPEGVVMAKIPLESDHGNTQSTDASHPTDPALQPEPSRAGGISSGGGFDAHADGQASADSENGISGTSGEAQPQTPDHG